MSLPKPFEYPMEAHERKHGPQGYTEYHKYKNWLRDEFEFRCVYCLEREVWYPDRQASFSIDHVEAQVINPDAISNYDNLVYACRRCNSAKREVPILDPTREGLGKHLEIDSKGRIRHLTREGEVLIELLHLDDDEIIETREEVLAILSLKQNMPEDEKVHLLFDSRFRYPRILPDLVRYRPPGGNTRPKGVMSCHFQRRKEGKLPSHY